MSGVGVGRRGVWPVAAALALSACATARMYEGEATVYVRSIDGRANLIYGSSHEIVLDADPGVEYRLESTANPTTRCSVRVAPDLCFMPRLASSASVPASVAHP